MERDGQLDLYDRVAARLKDAHARVRTLQVPESVRVALTRKLLVITAAAKHDPADAVRRLDRLMADIDEERLPGGRGGPGADGSPCAPTSLRHKGD
ncbi:hypothetical protein [Streptomyces phytohabitans]|uniref:hypothetical protein n=1 Tax=Streptomyces phytohabitans TaxID=1150371 RepID=UPI00345B7328